MARTAHNPHTHTLGSAPALDELEVQRYLLAMHEQSLAAADLTLLTQSDDRAHKTPLHLDHEEGQC
jgi:hypothetical protein